MKEKATLRDESANAEDDVIARMEYAMQDLEYENEWERPCFDKLIIAALRAVHDTHRLVPVEPTEEIRQTLYRVPQAIAGGDWPYVSQHRITPTWRDALNAAPDYTRPFGEDTDDAEGPLND